MWERKKKRCASSLKSLKFIIPRGIQDSSKRDFIKKRKDSSSIEMCKNIEARKRSRVHQNDLSWEEKGRQNIPKKSSFNQEMRDTKKKEKEKKRKPVRLKTQKGSLGKS